MKAVLFDLDGTLTDPKTGITKSVAYALERFGIKTEKVDALTHFIGPPLVESFMKYYQMSKDQANKAVEYYREYFKPYGIFENVVYPDIPEMLKELKKNGFRLYIASSKPEIFVKQITDRFGLTEFFEDQIGSEMDGRRIKKSEVITEAMKRGGLISADTIMVGDRSHDIIGAKEAGIPAVGVKWGFADDEELESAGAVYIADTVLELKRYLISRNTER